MKIADLQGRVELNVRHDLPSGYAESALQDAARFVAAKSGILRAYVTTSILSGAYATAISDIMANLGDRNFMRVTRIWVAPALDPKSRQISAGVITTLPDPSLQPDKGYILQTGSGPVLDGLTVYPSKPGDFFQIQGGVWVWIPFRKYSVLKDRGLEYINRQQESPHLREGYPSGYGFDKDYLHTYPTPQCDVPMRFEYSYVPIREFEDVDFPVDAEWALIATAKAYIAKMPNKSGTGANVKLAQLFENEAMAEILQLRHIAEGGYGDSFMSPPGIFGA